MKNMYNEYDPSTYWQKRIRQDSLQPLPHPPKETTFKKQLHNVNMNAIP